MKQQCILTARRRKLDTPVLIIIKMAKEICTFLNCDLKNVGDVPLEENIMFEATVGYIQSSVILKSHVQNKQLLNNFLLFITSTRKIRVMWSLLKNHSLQL